MAENKVRFTLKNVHYAVLTDEVTPAYDTPVSVPGAVNLLLNSQSEVTPFYADGMIYYQSVANNGYSGDLEMARFTDKMLKDVWSFIETEDKVLLEIADAETKAFALLFQIDGDADNEMYLLYNCSGTKPAVGAATSTKTKDPQTQSSTISAVPLLNGYVMARTSASTAASVKENWFKEVHIPSITQTAQTAEE